GGRPGRASVGGSDPYTGYGVGRPGWGRRRGAGQKGTRSDPAIGGAEVVEGRKCRRYAFTGAVSAPAADPFRDPCSALVSWQHAGLWCRVVQVRGLGAEPSQQPSQQPIEELSTQLRATSPSPGRDRKASSGSCCGRYSGTVSLTPPAAVIILAAGQGTRMKSATPKVLHSIGGRSLLGHVMHTAAGLDPQRIAVVVRHERDQVAAHAAALDPAAVIADQDEIPGTGRAVECGLAALDEATTAELQGPVVILAGDV